MKLSSTTSSIDYTSSKPSLSSSDQDSLKERLYNQKENMCQNNGMISQQMQAQNAQQQQHYVQLYSEENADKQQEGSLTTNESCSSYHSDEESEGEDNKQILQKKNNLIQWSQYNQDCEAQLYDQGNDYENIYEQDMNQNEMQEQESEEDDDEVSSLSEQNVQDSQGIVYMQEKEEKEQLKQFENGDEPFQFKTLKLQSLKERGNLIYFEEYDPMNHSNRNNDERCGVLMTGGRTASNASNSNRFSLSKTINFNMAMYYPQDLTVQTPTSQNQDSIQNQSSSQRENVPSSQQSLQSTAREKINQFSFNNQKETASIQQSKKEEQEKQNMGTQTLHEMLSSYQLTPNKSVHSECQQKDSSSIELSSSFAIQNVFQVPFSAREEQSKQLTNGVHKPHSSSCVNQYLQQPQPQQNKVSSQNEQQMPPASPFSLKDSNMSLNHIQSYNNTVQSSIHKQEGAPIYPQRMYQRVGALQNRASQQQHQVFAFAQTQNLQSSYNKNQSRKSEEMPQQRKSNKKAGHHERKWSESSNNQNINSQGGGINGISNMSFSRTIAIPNLGQIISSQKKKKEDYIQDLKYMLENVQCEAKNLKLLLNLKDDQLQLYENKTIDLINENDETQNKFDDIKNQYDMVEEENLYLKAVVNSFNKGSIIQKKTFGMNTDQVQSKAFENKVCQVQILDEKVSIGISPIKEIQILYDQASNNNQKQIQMTLQNHLQESEKENINLMNKIDVYADKFKQQEMTMSSIQNDYGLMRKENNDLKKQLQKEGNSLYWQIENQKVQLREREQKIMEVYQVLEENKHLAKKKSNKIKSLKKERDCLKIEILKLKQIYSDKCDIQKIIINNQYDNYKEIKHKLQKKLKKREEKIMTLEEKVSKCEQYYKKQIQNSNRGFLNIPEWAINEENNNDFEQSSQFMRSSIRSKSLENTGNFNSTAKNQLKFQGMQQYHQNKEQSQKVTDLFSQNQHNSSTSNNNTNSVPIAQYNNFNHYNGFEDCQKNGKEMNKYGKQLERELERQQQVQNQGKLIYQSNQEKNGYQMAIAPNYVSGDKSKSFYSSDVENNTFFDPANIILGDQSNSSNFFSNVNNSNSQLFVDDSGIIMMGDKINQYLGLPSTDHKQQKNLQPPQKQNKQLPKVGSSNQIKIQNTQGSSSTKATGPTLNNKVTSGYQPQSSNSLMGHISKKKKKRNDSYTLPANQTPINMSYLQSLQLDDQQNTIQTNFTNQGPPPSQQQSQQSSQQQQQLRCYTKSPISKSIQQNMIPRNRSSSNLQNNPVQQQPQPSNQDPQNTTQHTIRQQQNDSTTSSNRNLHQIKTTQRPTSTSSTNNTTTVHHNQAAMVSYQSSSSGGSKNYQSKNPHPSQKISHASYLTNQHQLGQSYQSQQNSSSQFIQNYQIPQKSNGTIITNGAVGNVQQYEHKRQRSRCFESQQIMGTGVATTIENNGGASQEKWQQQLNPMRQSYVSSASQQNVNHFNH